MNAKVGYEDKMSEVKGRIRGGTEEVSCERRDK